MEPHHIVLAKNFQTDISAFAHIPAEELFIFPARMSHNIFSTYSFCNYPS